MTPNKINARAREIAEQEIGGAPPRCTGPEADRYNAAFNAVVKALSSLDRADCQELTDMRPGTARRDGDDA